MIGSYTKATIDIMNSGDAVSIDLSKRTIVSKIVKGGGSG